MSPRISSEKTPTVMVFSSAGETKTSAYSNSFHDKVKANRAAQITPGTATGSRIRSMVCRRLQPSSIAHSSIYFRTVPKEIAECAMLDGCNRLQTMLRILLPVAVPGVICAALFAFTLSWNEFLYALVFVSPAELKTMTVGVFSELIRGDIYYWGGLMAGACIGSLPIVVAYVFFLDYYVSGLTAGAVK